MNSLQVDRKILSFTLVLVSVLMADRAHTQAADKKEPVVSDKPLTVEQLAVYRVVLKRYLSGDTGALNLSIHTVPVATEGPFAGHNCSSGIAMEATQPNIIHSLRSEDLAALGLPSLHLVDPDQQGKTVKKNDPGKAIRRGIPVDNAVKNGFANALFSLSEVWFDKTHQHAIVSYGFWCGRLCGNGGSLVLMKKGDDWSVQSQCGGWVS